jgi:hypothetical protein
MALKKLVYTKKFDLDIENNFFSYCRNGTNLVIEGCCATPVTTYALTPEAYGVRV